MIPKGKSWCIANVALDQDTLYQLYEFIYDINC